MRTILCSLVLGVALLSSTGCILPIYSADPQRRAEQLMNESEGLRQIKGEWERLWLIDMPTNMTPERVHGGVV